MTGTYPSGAPLPEPKSLITDFLSVSKLKAFHCWACSSLNQKCSTGLRMFSRDKRSSLLAGDDSDKEN